jgi:hypothetical protein
MFPIRVEVYKMARLIDFQLDPDTRVLVEVGLDTVPQGPQRVSAGGVLIENASEAFDTALAGIKPIARSIMTQLGEAVADAKEIQVEFGIKLTASAGVVLAKASTEGHCKISIKWER